MWRRCTGVRDMSSPSSAMRPVWPVSRPDTSLSSVDLPEPAGPDHCDQLAGAHVERDLVQPVRAAGVVVADRVEEEAHGVTARCFTRGGRKEAPTRSPAPGG